MRRGRLPDDEPHDRAGAARRAGEDDGVLRRATSSTSSTRPGALTPASVGRARRRAARALDRRGRGRLPRAQQPRLRRSATRSPRSRPARPGSTARCAASAPAPAMRHRGRSSRRSTSSARDERRPLPADGRRRGRRRAADAARRRSSTATALSLGYAGVYSLVPRCTPSAPARKYRRRAARRAVELGRRRVVGGQEDMIIAVAAELAEHAR